MSKVTSKLQVTIPKALAERYGIRPGDEIEWEAAGPFIRIVPASRKGRRPLGKPDRLWLFDEATGRQEARERRLREERPDLVRQQFEDRGWRREELYVRGSSG